LHLHCDSSSGSSVRNTPTATAGTLLPKSGASWFVGSTICRMVAISCSSRPVLSACGDTPFPPSLAISSVSLAAASSACSSRAALWVLSSSWLALSCAACASPALAESPLLAAALTLPSARGPPHTVTSTSLGLMADGIPVPVIAILPPCCVCLPHYSCAPPSYCEHALVSMQCCRTAALANSFFSRGGLSRHSLFTFSPGDQSGPSG
jgi:hypothetical protein